MGAMQQRRCGRLWLEAAASSSDSDKREDKELQEVPEALKAKKKQQQPDMLMGELIKRK